MATSTDAREGDKTFTYDALNRQTQMIAALSGLSNITPIPSPTTLVPMGSDAYAVPSSGPDEDLSWAYTPQGREASRTESLVWGSEPLTYVYNNVGQATSLTYPSGAVVGYTYNGNNQVASMNLTINGTTTTLLTNVQYEPFGQVKGWTWGNGGTAVRSHDTDGRVSTISTTGLNWTLAYDSGSRVSQINDADSPTLDFTYTYDALDRLTSSATSAQTINYTLDANGNMLTETLLPPSESLLNQTWTMSGTNNHVATITGTAATYTTTITPRYDPAGNATFWNGAIAFAHVVSAIIFKLFGTFFQCWRFRSFVGKSCQN